MTDRGLGYYQQYLLGDENAVEGLVRTYSDPLVRYVYCYVANAAAAEDIMEETLVTLILKKKQLSDPESFRSYLYKIARNKSIDYLRRKRNDVSLDDVAAVLSTGDLESHVSRRARNETIYIAMQSLPKQYREVLHLAYLEGYPLSDVCVIMNKSIKQVYNLLARAKAALKELLEKEGISHEDL